MTTDLATKPTVLFVDDEESVLAGLRSSLHRLRKSYRLLFAVGADEALLLLDEEAVDMVVTDMRMPGRTGVDLMEEMRFRHPHVVRYVLSGEADTKLIRRSVPVAHRWLAKPCDRDDLIEALAAATGHRDTVADDEVRQAVAAIDALPTPPAAHRALVALAGAPDVVVDDVVELVATDPAVVAKLLQWANSAFTDGRPVTDVRTAVTRIGLSVLGGLVSADEVVHPFAPTEVIPGLDPDVLQRHTSAVADLAFRLARPDEADDAWIGGLLCGVGLLVEVRHLSKRLTESYRKAEEAGIPLIEAERRLFDVTHPELCGHLLSLWGLPRHLVELAAGAHDRPRIEATVPMGAAEAVRAARLLAQRLPNAAAIGEPHIDRPDPELAAALDAWEESLAIGSPLSPTPMPPAR